MYLNTTQFGDFQNFTDEMGALGDATLRKGSRGQDVTDLQNLLIAYFRNKGQSALPRYGADGDYGGETYDWVRKFQQAEGLGVDGVAGPNTISRLKSVKKTGTGSVTKTAATTAKTSVVSNTTRAPESYAQPKTSSSGDKAWYMDTMNQIYMGVGVLGLVAVLALATGGKKKKRATA